MSVSKMYISSIHLYAFYAVLVAWATSMGVQAQSSSATSMAMSISSSPPASSSVTIQPPRFSSASGIPPAVTHTVQVGLADHKFRPDTIRTAQGDTVEFQFYPANHSVVRAEWGVPCIPYEMTGPGKAGNGFFSSFHAVASVLENPPTWSVLINNTEPIFFYCSAPGSCTTYGMVGVINPNTSVFLDEQRNLALKADYALSPGEPFPAEAPSAPSSSSSSSPNPAPTHSSGAGKLGTGAIAGIVIACVGVVVLGGLLFFFWGRFKGLRDEMRRKDSTVLRTSSPSSPRLGVSFWHSSSSAAMATANQQRSLAYTDALPMSSHAKPESQNLPPAYYPSPLPTPIPELGYYDYTQHPLGTATTMTGGAGAGVGGDGVSRVASHRSTGGTFDLSPKGYYTRAQNPHTSDMTSLTDPNLVPVGPYGRQMMDLQRLAVRSSNSGLGVAGLDGGYFEGSARPKSTVYHMAQHGPVEIEDTSVRQSEGKTGNFM